MADPIDIAAALDNHQVTDDDGQVIGETTPPEEPASGEETTVDEAAQAEKSAEPKESTPVEDKGTETPEMVELAADETGKRYVPETRFKEVYGKWKDAERKLKDQPKAQLPPLPQLPQKPVKIDKTDALERELLRSTLPQFDPRLDEEGKPTNPEYSRELDELGFSIYESSKNTKGEHTMTMIDAGRKALQIAKKLTAKVAEIKTEARTVKAQQSDQGITNRVLTREGTKIDPDKMTLEEMEEYLKANNEW